MGVWRGFSTWIVDPAGFDPARADGARVRGELGLAQDAVVVGQIAFFYPPLVPPIAPPGMEGRGIKGHEDLMAAARLVLEACPTRAFSSSATVSARPARPTSRRCAASRAISRSPTA